MAELGLDDFLTQLRQIKKMGSLEQVLSLVPGLGKMKGLKQMAPDDKELARTEAIICSMTAEERRRPRILNGSRRKRIAMGSGTNVAEVNKLLKNFNQMQKMIKKMGRLDPSRLAQAGGLLSG